MTVSSGWASGTGGMASADDAKVRAKATAINLIIAYLPLLAGTKTRDHPFHPFAAPAWGLLFFLVRYCPHTAAGVIA
jgi:hypothetical protein